MKKTKIPLGARLKYAFDNLMSRGGTSVFLALMALFIGAIILMSCFRLVANLVIPQENMVILEDQWWITFLQITDAGAVAEDTDSNFLHRIVGIVSIFLGLVLFSSLVAFITSQFEETLARMRKGKSDVIEKNHTLILGFGERVLEIIRELIIANESERRAAIVVLSHHEKDEMDDFFREKIEQRKTTRIITRSGSTSSVNSLKRVGIPRAKSVIILNDAPNDSDDEEKEIADARVLKTIMAVITCCGEDEMPPVLAELHHKQKQNLALKISDRVSVIDVQSVLARLMVQTSRISGLAQVYDQLVGFAGNEFYFYRPSGGWKGLSYNDLVFHFHTTCVLGIRYADGSLKLNPVSGAMLGDEDELILLAEDDSTIKISRKKFPARAPITRPAGSLQKMVEKQLIVGWNQKAGIIVDEYSQYLVEGSSIDLVIDKKSETILREFKKVKSKYPAIQFRLIRADIRDLTVISRLKPDTYDNVLILTGDGGEAELRDSETIAKLLEFRHFFRTLDQGTLKTQLITEVADSENIEVVQDTGVKDFLISNQFVSRIYAQVSEEPDVLTIYEDLFNEDGSEVYLKPLSLYLASPPPEISFGDLCAAAMMREETCFGVRIMAQEQDAEHSYGIYLNPPKNRIFKLLSTDMLITLAEDET
jgi:ion channel POLLUX/CASTOR